MQTTLRKLPAAWPLAILILLPALTRAETAVQAWVQRYNGLGNGLDQAAAMVVDGSNNVIVTGESYGGPESRGDSLTIKYSSAGAPLWTNSYNGPGNSYDSTWAAAVDRNNDVIVAGYSRASGGHPAYATIKYSSVGVPLWTNCYDGLGNSENYAYAVAVDGSNNVIVTGFSAGSGSYPDYNYDYATLKYSSGGEPLWTNRYNGPGNDGDWAEAVAVDGNNNVVVTGYVTAMAGDRDYATIKYSGEGMPLWTNYYAGPGNADDEAVAVAVDASNSVIVTGGSAGSGGYADYATIKYSAAGVPLWTNRYNGPGNRHDYATTVQVDGSNNVIVTGASAGTSYSPYNYDYATIKYSAAGVPLWTNRYNGLGNGDDDPTALAVDNHNNVILTGWSVSGGGYADYATIKYSSAGAALWTNRYSGPGDGYHIASAVAVDSSGHVIATGRSPGSEGNLDYATVKYVSVPSPVMSGLQLTNGAFQLRVDDVLQPGTLVIEASTNLAGWSPVFTNTAPTNVLFYTDPDAGGLVTRFYRAFQSP